MKKSLKYDEKINKKEFEKERLVVLLNNDYSITPIPYDEYSLSTSQILQRGLESYILGASVLCHFIYLTVSLYIFFLFIGVLIYNSEELCF